jgi:hypothetical protein
MVPPPTPVGTKSLLLLVRSGSQPEPKPVQEPGSVPGHGCAQAGAWVPGAAAPSLPARRAWGWGCLRPGRGSGLGLGLRRAFVIRLAPTQPTPAGGPWGGFGFWNLNPNRRPRSLSAAYTGDIPPSPTLIS